MPTLPRLRTWRGGCALLAGIAASGFVLLIILWVIRPPLEWTGACEVRFDDEAKDQAPKGATRIFFFHDNFGMDWAVWRAFTAPPAAVERYLWDTYEVRLSQFKAWDTKNYPMSVVPVEPVDPPKRDNWRNRGYWDIDKSPSGLLYEKREPSAFYLYIFYDPTKDRVFILEGSI